MLKSEGERGKERDVWMVWAVTGGLLSREGVGCLRRTSCRCDGSEDGERRSSLKGAEGS